MTDELKNQRKVLAEKVSDLYSPEDFPGSKAWRACQQAQRELNAFDAEHPEIIAAIKAERAAADKAAAEDAGWI